jgi:predicted MPP superfamily phosphohydrolase
VRFFSFSLLIGAGAVLAHLYLYRRLVRPLAPSPRWRRAVGLVLLAFTGLLLARGTLRDLGPPIAHVYAVASYSWIAFGLCMVCALTAGDLALGLLAARRLARSRLAGREPSWTSEPRDDAPSVDEDRRRFVASVIPWSVVAGGTVLTGYGTLRAFTPAEVSEVPIGIAKLPRTLDGLSIVQLTDIHVGPFIGRGFIDRLVEQANALRPDVLVITGDLVDGSVERLGSAVAGLQNLRARFGTYFITGNHEYYSGDAAWTRFLERLGITVLRNRRVSIGDDGGSFDLVGVDDWTGGRRRGAQGYDLETAIAGRDPERAAVLLAHQPTNFDVAVARGMDLQISGHTHGGQMFPMTMLVGLRYAYTRGLYTHGDGSIYVSRGCGFWGPPARIGSPPEIAKLVLTV